MRTLDEAIAKEKEMSEPCSRPCTNGCDCTECRKDHEQIAEWLEELKSIKSNGRYVQGNKAGQKIGYRSAIDDYMNKLCNHCMQQTNECYKPECPFCTDGCDVVNIAEKMKAGGENE